MNATQAQSLTQKTLLLNLTLGRVGNRKKVRKSEVNVTAKSYDGDGLEDLPETSEPNIDQDMLHVSKDLLDSPELVAIGKHMGKVRRFAQGAALPTSTLKSGMYMVPISSVLHVDRKLEEYKTELRNLVDAFCRVYPEKVQESVERLGALANLLDYPPEDKIREHFKIEWQYLTLEAPRDALGSVSIELLRREEQKIQAHMVGAVDQIQLAFAKSFQELVERLMEKLRPANGKQKKVTERAVEEFNVFFDMFTAKNVTGDGELAAIIQRARDLVNGATPDEMNGNKEIKDLIATQMDSIKNTIDSLVVDRGGRRVILIPNEQPVSVGSQSQEGGMDAY